MWYTKSIILVLLISILNTQGLVEVRRDDGSYSLGVQSNSVGGTGDSVAALLTKASGWTGPRARAGDVGVSIQVPHLLNSAIQVTKQVPYLEILRLVETFLKMKGQLAGYVWALIQDNSHILAALKDTLFSQISSLHNFTLNAVVILRKILEFASSLFGGLSVSVGGGGHLFDAGINIG